MNLTESDKEAIIRLLGREEAAKVSVFGSYARGEADVDSDVDILVEFSDEKSLMEVSKIERELSEELDMDVDLVTEKALHPLIAERIETREVLMA